MFDDGVGGTPSDFVVLIGGGERCGHAERQRVAACEPVDRGAGGVRDPDAVEITV